jgi:hypothetical protein
LERAKQKYDLFYTLKTHVPELLKNRDPTSEKVLAAIRQGFKIPLPNDEFPDGPKYFITRVGLFDPSKFCIEDMVKVNAMFAELMLRDDDNFVVAGVVYILDFTGISLSQIMQISPFSLKKSIMVMQDSMPIRQKAIHIVNIPPIAMKFFNIIKSLMNEKSRSRVRKTEILVA